MKEKRNNRFIFMQIVRKIIKTTLFLMATALLLLLAMEVSIWLSTRSKIYDSIEKLPVNKVGLILGTSKYLRDGSANQYYKSRIEAAVELYKKGKIEILLISGDNRTRQYNEPVTMRKDLVAAGIPVEKIVLDYAGFRTFDSVIRSNKVFGQKSITVISQPFQNQRAIFIANFENLDAVAYNAKDVGFSQGIWVQLRERLARVKMVIDLLFGADPYFLGEPVSIE
jgi:SanA protein